MKFIVCLWILGTAVHFLAADGAGHNRVDVEQTPVCAVSLFMSAGLAEGRHSGEIWRLALNPAVSVEFSFFELFLAGISLPFSIDAGYPYYGAPSLSGRIEAPVFEVGITGGSGATYYRSSAFFVPRGTIGSFAGVADSIVGGSIDVGFLRDPVALKVSGSIEVTYGHDHGLRLNRGDCSFAAMALLNEMVSIELGMGVDIQSSFGISVIPPGVSGSVGVHLRKDGFAASVSSRRNLWKPSKPALITAGITYGWSTS